LFFQLRVTGYSFPDAHAEKRFDKADEHLKQNKDRYTRGTVWFTLFERLWMLRGYENMLVDPYMNETEFCGLRDRILEFNLAMIDQWLERGINGIFFSDDWGSQKGLLINPDDWRKFYKPAYRKMFDRVHSGGAHVWMHLCGNITAILPDLIDIGLNVLNPVQPQAMDVKDLSREFGGKVCFHGGVDVQGTMIRGSQEDVRREAHELVDLFGSFNGGYIGGTSHSIMPETPLDNVIALYEAFIECQE
jgi:uroporphyrinogen decarboxylase